MGSHAGCWAPSAGAAGHSHCLQGDGNFQEMLLSLGPAQYIKRNIFFSLVNNSLYFYTEQYKMRQVLKG